MIGIYKITNKINNQAYIGLSKHIEKRFKEHKTRYNVQGYEYDKVLYRAIRKYGIENFDFSVLETFQEENYELLKIREIYWIKFYDTFYNGYNETLGGDYRNVSEEQHPNHKLTKEDVIDIRIRWHACCESTREIYEDYKDRIGKSGFKKIYSWQTWKNILPELYTQEAREWHKNNLSNYANPGEQNSSAILSDAEVLDIRTRVKNCESVRKIYKDYEHTGITYGSFCNTAYGYNRKYIVVV